METSAVLPDTPLREYIPLELGYIAVTRFASEKTPVSRFKTPLRLHGSYILWRVDYSVPHSMWEGMSVSSVVLLASPSLQSRSFLLNWQLRITSCTTLPLSGM